MQPRKTPTSSLSGNRASNSPSHCLTVTAVAAIELLVKRIWYRTKARTWGKSSGGASPGTSATLPSPAMRLPQEIIEIIIAHLTYDLFGLRSCSLTCHSWYTAAVPHLHHTLTTSTHPWHGKFKWPHPIRFMHTFGLLPFVKTIRICNYHSKEFSPKQFDRSTLRQLSALTNIQRLEIDNLDIPSFMPMIRQYFGPFLPTLQSLHLKAPKGSNRQIIFFIGLFQHLEDLTLYCTAWGIQPEEDLTLIPPFAPPLRGQLAVWHWTGAGFFQEMVHLFGEIRFEAMDLFYVDETRFLLRACAKTLRVLKLRAADPRGERL